MNRLMTMRGRSNCDKWRNISFVTRCNARAFLLFFP
uniref:Uncharacterized protein n=1 Tax=Aegilops tauschii subsp. strangulata TaxID=200361 RepID=A0A453RWY0_AEGTS